MKKLELLADNELSIVRDKEFLTQKRKIQQKISWVLSDVEQELKASINQNSYNFPTGALLRSGKISRGENYKGLPYLVLDYPRYSNYDQVFFFRTMFWWGNYFICLLITQNCDYILKPSSQPAKDLWINLGDSPWNYDLTSSDWKAFDGTEVPSKHPFIAIARTLDLENIKELPSVSRATFESTMTFLGK